MDHVNPYPWVDDYPHPSPNMGSHWGHWGHDFVNSDFEIFLLLVGNSWWCTWPEPALRVFFLVAMIMALMALISFHVLFSFNHLISNSSLCPFLGASRNWTERNVTSPFHPCSRISHPKNSMRKANKGLLESKRARSFVMVRWTVKYCVRYFAGCF